MNELIKGRLITASGVVIAALALTGCSVDEDYDLTELDTNVTLLKNVSMPLGDAADAVSIEEILNLDEAGDFIVADDEGNLSFVYSPEKPMVTSFSVPEVNLSGADYGADEGGVTVNMKRITVVKPSDLPEIPDLEVHLPEIEFEMALDQEKMPELITDIKRAEFGDSHLTLKLGLQRQTSSPVSGIILEKGATLTFPEWIEIQEVSKEFTQSADKHTFELTVDYELAIGSAAAPEEFTFAIKSIDFEKLPEGQGITNGEIHIDDKILFKADMKIPVENIKSSGSFSPTFLASLYTEELKISKVLADIEVDMDESLEEIHFEGLPEFLADGSNVLDFTDVRLDLSFQNRTPLAGRFSIDIKTFSAFDELASVTIATPKFTAASDEDRTYMWSFAESDASVPHGYEHVQTPGLNGLLSRIPERIAFGHLGFTKDEGYIEVELGKTYEGGISYSLCAPLSFGKDMQLGFTMDIDDMNVNIENMNIGAVELALDMTNTIPLDFMIDVRVLDESGEEIPDITMSLGEKYIKAGSLEAPQTSPLKLSFKNMRNGLSFDGIRLTFKAKGSSEHAGTPLNLKQGLELSNMVLTLPEGISTEL